MRFNLPICMALIERAKPHVRDEKGRRKQDVESYLAFYETLTVPEWREMILGMVYEGGGSRETDDFSPAFDNKEAMNVIYDLPLYRDNDPRDFGDLTMNILYQSSMPLRKKIKIAYDALAKEGLRNRNVGFITYLLFLDACSAVDVEILLKIYDKMRDTFCHQAVLRRLVQNGEHAWHNRIPFAFWKSEKEKGHFELITDWILVCLTYHSYELAMEAYVTYFLSLTEWKEQIPFVVDFAKALNRTYKKGLDGLLGSWADYCPAVQEKLSSFLKSHLHIQKDWSLAVFGDEETQKKILAL
jgi:hypothetical protein